MNIQDSQGADLFFQASMTTFTKKRHGRSEPTTKSIEYRNF